MILGPPKTYTLGVESFPGRHTTFAGIPPYPLKKNPVLN
jgi:hypothetical protein